MFLIDVLFGLVPMLHAAWHWYHGDLASMDAGDLHFCLS
jgi:hypothetical protein